MCPGCKQLKLNDVALGREISRAKSLNVQRSELKELIKGTDNSAFNPYKLKLATARTSGQQKEKGHRNDLWETSKAGKHVEHKRPKVTRNYSGRHPKSRELMQRSISMRLHRKSRKS